jgi:geranylgeranyl pyrophosphate synthase
MGYEKTLEGLSRLVDDDLRERIRIVAEEGKKYHPFVGEVCRAVEDYVLRGGIRMASCSTLIVYQGYAGRTDENIIKAGAAIDLYRQSILAHDDIADAELFRRGGKTLHKIFEEKFDEHFGIGTAIFAGNVLYSLSLDAIMRSGFEKEKLVEAVGLLATGYREVNESQMLDLLFEYKAPDVAEWSAMTGKRAASLFKTSMLMGAILASAPKKDLLMLGKAAVHMGYAFDIQDDIIDTFATKEQYGRDPGGDLTKRKKPLHVILAMQKDPRMASIFQGNSKITEEDIPRITAMIRDCGALDEAKTITREHGKEAKSLIAVTEMNREAKEVFIGLIEYVEGSLDWYK